ncbi:MAG: hypothetical protein HY840_09170 [Bacteroidetes bacterium]|nr:hypothetical protein [Bacteroidota bacterium]
MRIILLSVILIITGFVIKSQTITTEVIITAGNYNTNSYASLSVTIDKIVTKTVSNPNNIFKKLKQKRIKIQ